MEAIQAVDVTGAGDSVLAAFTLALAAGATALEAAQIANIAGGLVVMKRGQRRFLARSCLKQFAPKHRAEHVRQCAPLPTRSSNERFASNRC
jgi:bifunctional ADP-heptose synthase (sugar kinase/adenylyltransferase)